MAEVEKAVVEKFDYGTYIQTLAMIRHISPQLRGLLVMSTARQRAEACVAVIEAGEAETE